jgi:AcrR family transcriptional regulator
MKHDDTTKARIIEVALECFGELGYEGTSMRLIAEKSGISKPAIYYYFPDKEKLFIGIVDYVGNKFDSISDEIVNFNLPALEKLKKFILVRFQPHEDYLITRKFMNRLLTGGIKIKLPKFDHNIFEKQQQYMIQIINQGINEGIFRSDIDVQIFLYSLTGLIMLFSKDHFIDNKPPLDEKQVDTILAQLMEGIGIKK